MNGTLNLGLERVCSPRHIERSSFDGIKSPDSWDTLQCMLSPVFELNPRTRHEERHRCGGEKFAGLGLFEDTSGDMDPYASDVLPAELHLPGMQSRPNRDSQRIEGVAEGKATSNSPAWTVEGGEHTVTSRLHHATTVLVYDGLGHSIMALKQTAPASISKSHRSFSGADDVGEQD